jgi:S-DNA-T family DNA segregation ATPase FtsK/SpoIIIE
MPEFASRPPRIQPELPFGEITIPNPPTSDTSGGQQLVQVALPLVTIIGYVFVSAMGQGRSMLLLIPMGLSVVASSVVALISMIRTGQIERQKREAYAQRLVEMRQELTASHEMQRRFYLYNYPETDTVLQIAGDRDYQRSGLRLWERRTTDLDFGALRLGIGTRPSTVRYVVGSGTEDNQDAQMKDALKLAEDSLYVSDVPVTIPLRQWAKPDSSDKGGTAKKEADDPTSQAVNARYAIGIAGSDRDKTYDCIRSMMVHYAAFHAPTDARLFVVGAPDARSQWDWARWLPHCNTSRNQQGTGDQLCFEQDKARHFWDDLQTELDRRQLRLADKDNTTDPTLPHLLVVVDGLTAKGGQSPLNEVQAEASVSILLQRGPELGASIMFVVPERSQVPSDCKAVIEIESFEESTAFRYAEIGVNTLRYVGTADGLSATRADQEFARKLAPLAVRSTYGADLASAVSLLEMGPFDTVENVPILDNWARTREPGNSEWLSVPIGLMPGNKVRELLFSADGDGVHGMIAGTTGSGKSELLLTLIVGMAIKYDPSVINFVLVDYKGGAAFDPFRTLPHCVDIVTNLQGTAGIRTFTALRSELNRRSKLIADTNVKHIVHYRQKGLHITREPFPFLFVIVDEFAEMVKENPDFKAQLDSITRLGRALGVSLILATQRPAGAVTDQMRANMKFRICLRVETMEDSRELLRRSDAAFLPPNIPGRAYVQVGNENVELMQVARAGGPYTGPQIDATPPVIWLSRQRGEAQARSSGPLQEAPALSDVLVDVMHRMAQDDDDVVKQKKPWPDPLPEYLPLDVEYIGGEEERNPLLPLNPAVRAWLRGEGGWHGVNWQDDGMRAVVGLIDNPIRAEQLLMRLDLTRGHTVIFGASGWGKTTFLRTLIISLAATHSPDDLQMYFFDFGGRGLDVLEALPHRGASISPSEEERVQRLLRRLEGIIEERKSLLSQARVDNLSTYNATHPDNIQPAILFVIDNFAEFKENYENLMDKMIGVARDGRAYGVHLVATAEQSNALPGKLFSLFTERLTLKLADSTEYANIVGRGVPGINDIAGRGFVAVERSPLEFQTAAPVSISVEEESEGLDENTKLSMLAQLMSTTWEGKRPEGIDVLRSIIPLRSLLPETGSGDGRIETIIGLEDLDLKPARLDLQLRGPHFVVTGPPLCGKTTALRSWVLSLAHTYVPEQVEMVLIDFQQRMFKYGGKHTLGDLPHVLATVSEKEELKTVIENLKYEYQAWPQGESHPEIFIIADNYDDFTNIVGAATRATEYSEMAELARKFGPEGLHFVIGGTLSIMRSMDDLMKQVVSPRYGLGLDASDAPGALGGRVRSGGSSDEFPPGRGYVVKAGRLSMIQTAIPHDESDLEGSLDKWVEELMGCCPNRARWYMEINPPPEPEPEPEAESAPAKTSTPTR